ncbi:PfkB family carbohydrate kinase [Pseudonocardia oroxyli]|uniref:RfaE bifunctional protein, domain I/rfaE bifunctional protein, domain II n=1 Tax=Pseudonocardia oroxyli TaxID=366584 RepID=A0A1G7XR62_PSEOR|nr:PfkB family carbohydrate kinase [Pseudonocardia oroxyli]SDG86677.1 rfaE bifunctional protein, domain I/rfaE bifunctional protein, domain II [Pseudonocardia oroxyli]
MAVSAAGPRVAPAAAVGLAALIADRRPRVLVLGDAALDGWVFGTTRRVARDGPVPVVDASSSRLAPGGAANAAAALAALGADVELVCALGDDPDGRMLRGLLADAGVRTSRCVLDPGTSTTAKHRVVAGDQPVARYDAASGTRPGPAAVRALADQTTAALADHPDAVLVADYGRVPAPVRRRVARARGRIPLLVVDAHDPTPWAALRPDAVCPSAAEAADALGVPHPREDRLTWGNDRAGALRTATGAQEVLLTLDVDGAVWLGDAAPLCRPAGGRAASSAACGAGDVFAAAWTAAVAAGVPRPEALSLAQTAADVVVGLPGTAVCTTAALASRLAAGDPGVVLSHRDLVTVLAERRAAGARVVFTNGCFDVLHRGHVGYLREAAQLGDVLVVALNGDEGVRRLKGPTRPVNPVEDRAGVVGALAAVDLVTSFDTDSPVELLDLVRPDVYCKGGDYTPDMLPETPVMERLGGEIRILGYLADHSTSAIVARAAGS